MAGIKSENVIQWISKGNDEMVKNVNQITGAVDNLSKSVNKLVQNFGNSPRGIMKVEAALKDMQQVMEKQAATMEKLAEGFGKAEKAAGRFGERLSMKNTMSSFIGDMEKMIALQARWYGARMIIDQIIQVVETFARLPKVGAEHLIEVDKYRAMIERYGNMENQAASITKRNSEEIVQQARIMSVQLPIAFEEIMKSADRLLAAGVDIETVKGSLTSFAKLHISFPEINMEKFSTAIVGFLNSYRSMPGLAEMANDAERLKVIMDKLVVVLAKSTLAPGDITAVIQYMGQIGSAAGFSIDQIGALAGMITNLGSKAGPAARSLRGLMLSMTSDKGIKQMEAMGIKIDRTRTIAEQFRDILVKIRDLTGSGQLTVESINAISGIASTERMSPLLALIKELPEYDQLLKDVQGSTGALDRVSSGMGDTLGGLVTRIKNLWNEIGSLTLQSEILRNSLESTMLFMKGFGTLVLWVGSAFGHVYVAIVGAVNGILMIGDAIVTARKMLDDFVRFGWSASKRTMDEFADRVNASKKYLDGLKKGLVEGGAKGLEVIWGVSGEQPALLAGKSGKPGKKDQKSFGITPPEKGLGSALRSEVSSTTSKYKDLLSTARMDSEELMKQNQESFKRGEISAEQYYNTVETLSDDLYKKETQHIMDWAGNIKWYYSQLKKTAKTESELDAIKTAETTALVDVERKAKESQKYDLAARLKGYRENIEANYKSEEIVAKANAERQKLIAQQIEAQELASIERRKAVVQDLFGANRLGAVAYYSQMEEMVEKERDLKLKAYEDETNAKENEILQEMDYLESNNQYELAKYKELTAKLNNLDVERALTRTKIEEETKNKLTELRIKSSKDVDYQLNKPGGGYASAIGESLDQVIAGFPSQGAQLLSMVKGLADAMTDTFSDFFFDVMTNKLKSLGDYITSFLQSVSRAMSQVLAQQTAMSIMSAGKSVFSMLFHEGGTMGEPTGFRLVPAASFVGAPRHHTGIGPGEHAAIIRNDEGVFTKGQMAALGRGLSGASQGMPVSVNIVNQTSQPIQSSQAQVKFEPDKIVVTTILRDVKENGPISRALRGR